MDTERDMMDFDLPAEPERKDLASFKISEFFEDPFAQAPEGRPEPPPVSASPESVQELSLDPSREKVPAGVAQRAEPKPKAPVARLVEDPAETKIIQITVAKQFQSLRKQLQRFFKDVEAEGRITDMEGITVPMMEIVDHLQNHEDHYVYRIFFTPKEEYESDPLLYHSIGISILSAVLGNSLGFNTPSQLMEIALCGLLLDVGMIQSCPDVWKKEGPLGEEDQKRIQEHPITSFRLLKAVKGRFHFLDLVALQSHEREDGSGYPNRLMGKQIHPYAKIMGLCDVAESLTHPRSWREAYTSYDMVKILLSGNKQLFDTKILKRFLQRITPFPPGSLVQINTGEIGHVVHVNRDNPLRPVVQVEGNRRGETRIDLKKSPLLYVVKTFKPGEKPAETTEQRPAAASAPV